MSDAEKARDAGIDLVMANSGRWADDAHKALDAIANDPARPPAVIGEDLRHLIVERVGKPHHPNAWGGLIAGAVKRGRLLANGDRRNMADTQSHARNTAVYVLIPDAPQ